MTQATDQSQALAGRNVVVTRPAHQAEHLAELIRRHGGKPILFPVLEIADIQDLRPLHVLIDRLDLFDVAIFISPNAVNKAINLIKARRTLPAKLKIVAIGKGSSKELERFGITDVIAPAARFDSENLLALPQMLDITGKHVVIFRGEGGREMLGDTLVSRGATVEYAECYRRSKPDANATQLLHHWARGDLDAITVTSSEGLRNLYDMVGKLGQQWLKTTPLFVLHERIAEAARELGLEQVIVTPPGDEAMLQAIMEWFSRKS
jgi:uroporphyrinogen-III synthase